LSYIELYCVILSYIECIELYYVILRYIELYTRGKRIKKLEDEIGEDSFEALQAHVMQVRIYTCVYLCTDRGGIYGRESESRVDVVVYGVWLRLVGSLQL